MNRKTQMMPEFYKMVYRLFKQAYLYFSTVWRETRQPLDPATELRTMSSDWLEI